MEAFTLPTAQDVRIEAIGEEGTTVNNTLTVLRTVWNGSDRREQPWVGNAWILDLKNRRVVWELSEAQTSGRRAGPREFKGTLHLPAGSYAAYVSAYPPDTPRTMTVAAKSSASGSAPTTSTSTS